MMTAATVRRRVLAARLGLEKNPRARIALTWQIVGTLFWDLRYRLTVWLAEVGRLVGVGRAAVGRVQERLGPGRVRNLLIVVAAVAVVFDLVVASIKPGAPFQENLDLVRTTFFSTLQIGAVLLVGVLVVMLVVWLSGNDDGMRIMPFEDATGGPSKFGGVADALAAEISRIGELHRTRVEGIPVETLKLPALRTRSEDLSALTNVAAIGVGQTTVSVGAVLMALKRFWPIGSTAPVIAGSLQRYGSTIRLVARIEGKELAAIDAQCSCKTDDDILPLIRELAFKLVVRVAGTATTDWRALLEFTGAYEAFARFVRSKDVADLELAGNLSIAAHKCDSDYQHPLALLDSLANAYQNRKEYDKAEPLYRLAVQLDPIAPVFEGRGFQWLAYAYNGLGGNLWEQKRYEEALAAFSSGHDNLANDDSILHNVAMCLTRLERFPEALEALTLLEELHHVGASDAGRKGIVLGRLGRWDEALAAFDVASKLARESFLDKSDPESADLAALANERCSLLRRAARYPEAVAAHEAAIVEHPDDFVLRVGLAATYKALGDFERYERTIETVRAMPATPEAYNQACFEAVCGNADAAIPLLAQALAAGEISGSWAAVDPDLDRIREDERYRVLVATSGSPKEAIPAASQVPTDGATVPV